MQADVPELLLFVFYSIADLNVKSIEMIRRRCQQINGKLINNPLVW